MADAARLHAAGTDPGTRLALGIELSEAMMRSVVGADRLGSSDPEVVRRAFWELRRAGE